MERVGDFKELQKRISKVVSRIATPETVLRAIGEEMVNITKERFNDEIGVDGEPWKPSQRADENGGKTLQDDRGLYNSIDYETTSDTLVVGVNTPYAGIHQKGGVIKPKNGKTLVFTGSNGKPVFVQKVEIPARPYLGLAEGDDKRLLRAAKEAIRAETQSSTSQSGD